MTASHPITALFRRATAALKEVAPYAALELLLPGGSLLALVLWLHRRRRGQRKTPRLADAFGAHG